MTFALVQINGYDPVAGASVELRAASHDDDAICHFGGVTWWPAIAQLPTLRYDLFDGDFSGKIDVPATSMRLNVEPWPNIARYSLADARLQLWTSQNAISWVQRFDGRITAQPKIASGFADVAIAVDDRWLDSPLLTTYAGTGGAEGPEDLTGTVKPLALGKPRYLAGVLIDPINTVFQISGYGPIEAVEDALDGLARFGPPVQDYPTYAALIAATIVPGQWATALAVGMARHGAPPFGQITYMVRGDRAGPDGWVRTVGSMIRRIALMSGGAGKIDDTSIDAIDLACPWALSVALSEQTTARDIIARLAASVNAEMGVSWLGKLFVIPVALNTPSLTLRTDGTTLPPVASVEQMEAGAPFWRVAIQAERTWEVHPQAAVQYTAPGAPVGTSVGGRPVTQLLADFDLNSYAILAGVLSEAHQAEITDARTLLEGQPVSVKVLQERSERTEGQNALIYDLSLIGAKNAAGTGWVLNSEAVALTQTGGQTFTLAELGLKTLTHDAKITSFSEILTGPDGASGRSVNIIDIDGNITGTVNTLTGGVSVYGIMADIFYIVDPNDGNPFKPFLIEGGVVKMPNVEVDKLKVGSMDYEFVLNQTITADQGSQKLPGGVVMKWGKFRSTINSETQLSIVFDEPFPNVCQSFVPIAYLASYSILRDLWVQNVGEPTRFGAAFGTQSSTSNNHTIDGIDWLAFGT